MGRLLIHITCGPESPTRAALGLLVARAACDKGHDVDVFLAGDGVQLIREPVLDSLNGLGTGSLRESFDAVVKAGGRFFVCPVCFDAKQLDKGDLIAGAEINGTVPMWQWIGDEGATTFSY